MEDSARNGNGNCIVLQHPSGSMVYVVGTAHVSRKAAQDVTALIDRVSPAVVVVELDEERERKLREQAEMGDVYAVRRLTNKSAWEVVRMSVTGEALQYFMSAIYTITGAVMGTTPGGDFLAALEAAQSVGARVVLGDRDQAGTLRRLEYYTRHLTRRDSRANADMRRLRNMMDTGRREDGGGGPALDQPTSIDVGDPWGLGPDDDTEAGMRRRLLEMMREGGCPQPNNVLAAARRIFQDGLDPKGTIQPADILTVRECGNSLVESFRQRAMKGDSTWMQRLEQEQVAGAKGAAGLERSTMAMRKVIVDERDQILARRLWEAGLEAGPQPVVGVVGAGHVQGIAKYFPTAGEPSAEARVQRFLQAPAEERGSPWVTAAAGAAVLGTIAYRRPRAAALFAGAVALSTAPYFGFMLVTVNRFGKFATKLVNTSQMIDAGGGAYGDLGLGFEDGSTGGDDAGWK